MKLGKLLIISIIVIIVTFSLVAFSENEYIFGRDRILESDPQPQPSVVKNKIKSFSNSLSLFLEKETIDGSFLYSITDEGSKKSIGQVHYLPYQEYRPLYESLGNGDVIIAKSLILTKDGKILNFEKNFEAMIIDYEVYDNYLAFVSPVSEENKKLTNTGDNFACSVNIMDLSNNYSVKTIDKFYIPYELSPEPDFNIGFDQKGNIYYDFYDKTPKIKMYDMTENKASVFLNNALGVNISPFNDYMVYLNINSSSKEDRHDACLQLYDLSSNKSICKLTDNNSKLFWSDDKLVIFNDTLDLFDVYQINEGCKKIGSLDVPMTATEVKYKRDLTFSVKYYSYGKENITIDSKDVSSKKIE